MTKHALIAALRGGLIVSCQALRGEPLYRADDSVMYLFARAAKLAGAVAIRTNGVHDVRAIRAETGLPVIGLIKQAYPDTDVYITPTMTEVDALVDAGATIIATDCTLRSRVGGQTLQDFLTQVRSRHSDTLLMADVSTYEEGLEAAACGVDFVGTTLSGFTPYSTAADGPDYALVRRLAEALQVPVIAEGKIHAPEQARQMLCEGAHAVVVGGAITRPLEIATRFASALKG